MFGPAYEDCTCDYHPQCTHICVLSCVYTKYAHVCICLNVHDRHIKEEFIIQQMYRTRFCVCSITWRQDILLTRNARCDAYLYFSGKLTLLNALAVAASPSRRYVCGLRARRRLEPTWYQLTTCMRRWARHDVHHISPSINNLFWSLYAFILHRIRMEAPL